MPAGDLNFWPMWVAGSVGAALGDWLSYWIGRKLEYTVQHIWPLSKYPDLIPKGEEFIKKWGALGIFIGRFSGPLRASVPLVAGIFEMPFWRFQIANWVSAFVWAAVLLTHGRRDRQGLQADLRVNFLGLKKRASLRNCRRTLVLMRGARVPFRHRSRPG